MKRLSFLTAIAAATLTPGYAGVALACLPPEGPPPTAAERTANLLMAQTGAWSSATLVYEAEILETFLVVGLDDAHPGLLWVPMCAQRRSAYSRAKARQNL